MTHTKAILLAFLLLLAMILPIQAAFQTFDGCTWVQRNNGHGTMPSDEIYDHVYNDGNTWQFYLDASHPTMCGTGRTYYVSACPNPYYSSDCSAIGYQATTLNGATTGMVWTGAAYGLTDAKPWAVAYITNGDCSGGSPYTFWAMSKNTSQSFTVAPNAGYLTTSSTCYELGEAFTVTENSGTGTQPITYTWTLYEGETPLETQEYEGETGIEHTFEGLWDPGDYGVQLDVHNSAGDDFVYIEDFIHVGSAGECTYDPLENVTSMPTLAPIPTGIPNLINGTMWRAGCVGSALGNATEPYCDAVDMLANVTNGTFMGIIDIFTIPLDWMTLSVDTINSTIIVIASPLIGQSSLFLGMITRSLAILPAVMINIVTLGLAIDVVRVILRGKGGD